MFVSGIAMFMTAPIAGQLAQRFDPRYTLIGGFLLFAIGTWEMTSLTRDWDFWEIFWPQVLRGIGLMLSIVPVTNTALGTLPPERMKNASGLFNLTRNLGGALGLAVINTALNDRLDLHLARLHEAVNWSRGVATETLANIAARFTGSDADTMALKQMMGLVRQQAVVMSFADVFLMLTVLFVTLAALGVMMKRPAPVGAGASGH
jgi:DHA2 family multidrug resistance protein